MAYLTRRSMLTGIEHTLDVPVSEEKLVEWERIAHSTTRPHIQDFFPEVPAPWREYILTGSTPEEWEEMFAPHDESDE